MGKADLARMHRAPSANKARCRNAVMGASKRPMPRKQAIDVLTQDRMNAQRLLLILDGKLGQDTRHAARKHGLARSRRPNHEQAQLPRRRKRHAALGDLLPQHVGIIELGLKGGLDAVGIQIVPSRLAHTVGKLRQVIDKTAIDPRKRNMLVGPAGDKRQPHVASQQLERHLALDGKHRAIQAELAGNEAAVEIVAGNLPIGRKHRNGYRQVKAATGLSDIARRQIDRNARARDLESGRAHRAANAPTRLHDLHTRDAEHLYARNAARKRNLDRDGNRLDAADTGCVNGKGLERHHDTCQSNALYWCSISAICPPRMVTPTASKRIALSG